jgi:hypothetical protein
MVTRRDSLSAFWNAFLLWVGKVHAQDVINTSEICYPPQFQTAASLLQTKAQKAELSVKRQNMVVPTGGVVGSEHIPTHLTHMLYGAESTVALGFETHVHRSHNMSIAPDIVFSHLLKAAGTSIQQVLALIFNSGNGAHGEKYVQQSFVYSAGSSTFADTKAKIQNGMLNWLTPPSAGAFRIGAIRSPCDYLLSMWAFQSNLRTRSSHGVGQHQCLQDQVGHESAEQYYGREGMDSEELKQVFRRWVRVTAGKRLHYLTYRFYLAAHIDPINSQLPDWDDGQVTGCPDKVGATKEEQIVNALQHLDLNQRYDCLIHTESVVDDMRSCLSRYVMLISDSRIQAEISGKIDHALNSQSTLKLNAGHHGLCREYFDSDTNAFVWERESPLALRMGYTQCCYE